MLMLNSNEPIKVAHVQKLAKQLMLNGGLVTKMVSNYGSQSKKNFGRLIKRSNLKKIHMKNIFPLDFAKYLN